MTDTDIDNARGEYCYTVFTDIVQRINDAHLVAGEAGTIYAHLVGEWFSRFPMGEARDEGISEFLRSVRAVEALARSDKVTTSESIQ